MAKVVRLVISNEGVQALLKSAPIVGALKEVADNVASRAGPGYSAEAGTGGRTRGRAFVQTTDWESFEDNAKNNTLLKAIT